MINNTNSSFFVCFGFFNIFLVTSLKIMLGPTYKYTYKKKKHKQVIFCFATHIYKYCLIRRI